MVVLYPEIKYGWVDFTPTFPQQLKRQNILLGIGLMKVNGSSDTLN